MKLLLWLDYHSKISFLWGLFSNPETGGNRTVPNLVNRVDETFLRNQISAGHPVQPPICESEVCHGEEFDFKHLSSDCSKRNHLMFLISIIPVFSTFVSIFIRRAVKWDDGIFEYSIDENWKNGGVHFQDWIFLL